MKFLVEKVIVKDKDNFNRDTDYRGWIIPSGRIISTNTEKHADYSNDFSLEPVSMRYNFYVERYLKLPMHDLTKEQYDSLLFLLNQYFVVEDKNNIYNKSLRINLDTNDINMFTDNALEIDPVLFKPEQVISKIKSIYNKLRSKNILGGDYEKTANKRT